jgi:cytochrome c
MESNKVYAAILVAGILAMLSIIASGILVEPTPLKTAAYPIEGATEAPAGGEAKPAGPEPILPLLAKADADHGAVVAKQCQSCHTFTKGGADGVGPNNWGIVGAKHDHEPGYAYSDAMKNNPGTWDYEGLNKFLYAPQKDVPGTKMGFAGLKKAQDRADVIMWLRLQSDNPEPLPSADAAKK